MTLVYSLLKRQRPAERGGHGSSPTPPSQCNDGVMSERGAANLRELTHASSQRSSAVDVNSHECTGSMESQEEHVMPGVSL